MATKKLVHKTFHALNSDYVSEQVEALVSKLEKQNYLIKVIVHNPVTHIYTDGTTDIEYLTTVIATISEKIDIGLSLPE